MSNNKLIKYKENFITKIKKFFKRLFEKNGNEEGCAQITINENLDKAENQNQFMNEIKVDYNEVNKVVKKENFLEEIKGNEEELNMLSIDRLRKLKKYYDGVIIENEKVIKKLKTSV